jgi:signal transduction histidine kinase/DNA-binding response OmpR family regulator/HAMP domain-containing protein
MNINNIKISTQLKFGLISILAFVFLFGAVSYRQHRILSTQMATLYEHPFQVQNAIGELKLEIFNLRLGSRDLIEATNDTERQDAIKSMEDYYSKSLYHFDLIKSLYLGNPADVESAYLAFIKWRNSQESNIKLALAGNVNLVKDNITEGSTGKLRDDALAKIRVIDDFAKNKAKTLYTDLSKLEDSMNRQMILLISLVLLIAILISNILLKNILNPIAALTTTTHQFQEGDQSARCSYQPNNEFGLLSDSFNTLAQSIQENRSMQEKVIQLSGIMMGKYEAKEFFQEMISSLILFTGSQLGAVYLLSEDKKYFSHYESIGIDKNARLIFSSEDKEGEFGAVLSSRKVQHIKDIPKETRFIFQTVSGQFIPREILTIPILTGSEVVAIISLACINHYTKESLKTIDAVLMTLNARVEGVLAFDKMKNILKKLDIQNSELEAQKEELTSQSSELVQQNRELAQQKQALNESNRLKTNFLSNMSHELRTPLNSVIALSGVLNRRLAKKIPDEEYSYLEIIERNGKHLLDLINDILDISRIEAGREDLEISPFDANQKVAEIIDLLMIQAKEKHIELIHANSNQALSVSTDETKLRHIIQNLISNAIKFTEIGKVIVDSKLEHNWLTVTIKDTGIGISQDQIEYIFDEFRQADGSTSRRFGGTGLGLAIAKKYANLLGGKIAVVSTPGKGSAFTLSLPAELHSDRQGLENWKNFKANIKKPDTSFNKISQASTTAIHSPKTVLLVEDSEPAIIQMNDILEESGYHLLLARNGREALDMISKGVPDAIILDLMMPGVDGFDVLKTLRNEDLTANVPVMILTAKHITKEELQFLKRNNVHQLIQKGDINRAELLNLIHHMLYPIPPEEIQKTVSIKPIITGKPLVLIVEDNPDNMITAKALLSGDYDILEATEGLEAVEKAKKYKPDLVLMDIALPGMDGIQAFQEIRKDPSLQNSLVIALTASALVNDREAILAHGFDAYIPKPIVQELFIKTIKEVLYGK